MLKRAMVVLGASAMAGACLAPAAGAAGGPPLPKAVNGHKVHVVAAGLSTPTAFAFGFGKMFVADGGNLPTSKGGVFVVSKGKAKLLPGSPAFVAGVAVRGKTLWISGADFAGKDSIKSEILAWSGWNGTEFTKHKVFYTAPKKFPGFNGLVFGDDGRLYVGVDVSLTQGNDHGPAVAPYQYDILSFNPRAKHPRPAIFAKGMRQPWQMAWPKGSEGPFVTDLGQDQPQGINPPDLLLRVRKGDNYGFPKCNWMAKKPCKRFTKPFQLFAPHSDIGGIGIVGKTIYISEFGMANNHPQVVTVPLKGGKPKTFLSGFVAPIIGLGTYHGWIYVGSLAGGMIYRVHS